MSRSLLSAPWALAFHDRPAVALEVVSGGDAWLRHPDAGTLGLAAGDLALISGGHPYVIADRPETPVQVEVFGPAECAAPGEPAAARGDRWRLDHRTYGTDPAAPIEVIRGAYRLAGDVGRWLLAGLPPVAVVRSAPATEPWVSLLRQALPVAAPGQQVVLDRLLDALFVVALQRWLGTDPTPRWTGALADPAVGRALAALHAEPARPWTVDQLAAAAGMSRSGFARRFRRLVGDTPLGYLTGWRMTLAADALDTGRSVTATAREVGYGDPYGFSAAFKRHHGLPPSRWSARSVPRR